MTDSPPSRGQSAVVGNLLLVAVVIVAAGVLGVAFIDIATDVDSAPEQASVTIAEVTASNNDIVVDAVDDDCDAYHLVITMEHAGGAEFSSSDLEYVVELNGFGDEQLSGRFNSTAATPEVTVSSGEQIVVAIDTDTDPTDCNLRYDESQSAIVFGGETAWQPDDVGTAGELWDTHNTFMEDGSPDDLATVRVRIVDTGTDTVLVDEATSNIDDDSPVTRNS